MDIVHETEWSILCALCVHVTSLDVFGGRKIIFFQFHYINGMELRLVIKGEIEKVDEKIDETGIPFPVILVLFKMF